MSDGSSPSPAGVSILEQGLVVFDRFTLNHALGRGRMGAVWSARDRELEQDVALKFLPDVISHDHGAISDVKRATKRMLSLDHRHIIRIHDFVQDKIGAAISMELVDGETLSGLRVQRPNRCFNVDELGPWMQQICEALAYAHEEAKIVHRDIRPDNIMLASGNSIKIADFGIAFEIHESVSRLSAHNPSTNLIYISPQQARGDRASVSDDLYALGATLYDLLTSKPPFFSGNIQHQLDSITAPSMTARRVDLEVEGDPIPPVWEEAVAACLAKDPSGRPQSVRELASRLGLQLSTKTSIDFSSVLKSAPVPAGATVDAATVPAPAREDFGIRRAWTVAFAFGTLSCFPVFLLKEQWPWVISVPIVLGVVFALATDKSKWYSLK